MPTMYTATASGRRARTVNCEHCGHQFAYFMQRGAEATAVGTGLFCLIDPRFWKYGGYDGLAQARAERKLAKALEREIEEEEERERAEEEAMELDTLRLQGFRSG